MIRVDLGGKHQSVKWTLAIDRSKAPIAGRIGTGDFFISVDSSTSSRYSIVVYPIVVANVLSQTFPTSIAEVVVCWALVGTAFESLA